MSRFWILVLAAGCSSPSSREMPSNTTGDQPDAAIAQPDAPPADAPPVIEPVPVVCPNRTMPPGVPEHAYEPGEIYPTTITINAPADLLALNGIKLIEGDLIIGGTVTTVTLPDLEVVTGAIAAEDSAVTELHLPRLETANNFRAFRAPDFADLTIVEAPRLESLQLALYLQTSAVDLQCLKSILGATIVGPRGAVFALPRLETATSLIFGDLDATTVEIPAWQHGELEIEQGGLTTLHLGNPDRIWVRDSPNLATITVAANTNLVSLAIEHANLGDVDLLAGAPKVESVGLQHIPGLTSIAGITRAQLFAVYLVDVPALVDLSPLVNTRITDTIEVTQTGATEAAFRNTITLDTYLKIDGNPALTSLDIPLLKRLSTGTQHSSISNNPALPTCQATAIRDHTTLHRGASLAIAGNLADSCSALRP